MSFNLNKIKGLLKEKNLKVSDLAKKIGKAQRTLENYLSGTSKIDVYTLERIAEVLGVPVSYFFEEGSRGDIIQSNHNSIIKSKVEIKNIELEKECAKLKAELAGCRDLLKAKDEIIRLLRERETRKE